MESRYRHFEFVSKPRRWKFRFRIRRLVEVTLYVRKPKRFHNPPFEGHTPALRFYAFWGKLA